MKIHFVGHACIVAECADTSILMDPWLFGKIFNDSWTLLPEPKFDPAMLDKVDYIWLSHEHPDHCHFPTLDSFPAAFKARVTVLFQDRDYTKVFGALAQDWLSAIQAATAPSSRTAVRQARRDESVLLSRRPDGLGAGGA